MSSWILAIDFGTSYTVAAAKVDDRAPEIVEIGGERRMPSVVMVGRGGEVFVGRTAEDLSVTHPGSTLRALKNRLGDQTPAILDGRPHQVVNLVAALLREVYDQVVLQMGAAPAEVRLTHPATWNQPRVKRLLEAAAKAGLPNPLLVPEPVAAALSYAADVGLAPGRPVVVYDLGGGTFDSAVVTPRDGGFAVVGRPGGDQHIGGELFDELIVNHIGATLDPDAWSSIQVGDDPLWRQVGAALRNEARRAKEALSSHPYVTLLVPLPAGLHQVQFTRGEFHDLVRPYIAETVTTLERCVEEAGVARVELSGISLVGGCSRSPIVEEMVRAAFPTVAISRRGDPKATVAAGATLAERPTTSAPELWRSPVTQEASPGTARQRVRLAPPPLSEPPAGALVASARPDPLPPSTPPAVPPATPPSVSRPPEPPVSRPPEPPNSRRPAQPPTVAIPAIGALMREPDRSVRSRAPLLIAAALIVAGAVAAGVWFVNRSEDSGTRQTDDTSQVATPSSAPTSGATDVDDSDSTAVDDSVAPGTVGPVSAETTSVTIPGTNPEATSGSPSTGPAIERPIGTKLWSLAGHRDEVLAAAFNFDGSRVVTAALDAKAIVWDVSTGVDVTLFTEHTDEIYSAEFSPDGTMIATAGADRTIRLWNAESGEELHIFVGHSDVVFQVSFSPDGTQLLSASRDDTARVWDVSTGQEAAVLTGSAEDVYSAEWNSDGTKVVAGGQDDVVRVWDISAPDEPQLFVGHTADVQTAKFSPDGTLIISAGDDGIAKVWNADTGALIYNFTHGGQRVSSASFSPDGATAVTSSADRTARIWDIVTGAALLTLSGHTDIVYGSAFSPDGDSVVTASADGTAKLWDTATGSELATLDNGAPVPGAAFSPDGSLVITVSSNGVATIWTA